jgi:hypothetical protein
MSTNALQLLESIDLTLRRILVLIYSLMPKTIASDAELDSRFGNPRVRFDPRGWPGPSYKGRLMSECPPDYLELLAESFDYFAERAEQNNERTTKGKPIADFNRADAARARGWARRLRAGYVPATAAPATTSENDWAEEPLGEVEPFANDDDVPF